MSKNIETAKSIYDATNRQDMDYILDQLADDVSWGITRENPDDVPAHGIYEGKSEVPKFLAAWGETGEFESFVAQDFVAAGNHVFCLLQYAFRVHATGKLITQTDCLQHFTFDDAGKIVRWRGYEDTAATCNGYRT